MMQLLRPTYTLRIEVKDGPKPGEGVYGSYSSSQAAQFIGPQGENPYRYWKYNDGNVGCDEVLHDVRKALQGIPALADCEVFFERFEHR